MVDYLLISLCNVLYKLFLKVLADRIKPLLPILISTSQSVFVPRKQISDNVLVVYELVHFLKRGKKEKRGSMSIKLDMSKVYNRVEWDYLEDVLMVFNFPPRMISLLMLCVKSATYSIMVNGEPRCFIQPSRGLRQGVPLFPYLFFLYTEGLDSLLNFTVADRSLRGLRVCRSAPEINHVLFVDDTLIFCKVEETSSQKLLEILRKYELSSG